MPLRDVTCSMRKPNLTERTHSRTPKTVTFNTMNQNRTANIKIERQPQDLPYTTNKHMRLQMRTQMTQTTIIAETLSSKPGGAQFKTILSQRQMKLPRGKISSWLGQGRKTPKSTSFGLNKVYNHSVGLSWISRWGRLLYRIQKYPTKRVVTSFRDIWMLTKTILQQRSNLKSYQ